MKEKQRELDILYEKLKRTKNDKQEKIKVLGQSVWEELKDKNVKGIRQLEEMNASLLFSNAAWEKMQQVIGAVMEFEKREKDYKQQIETLENEGHCPECKAVVNEEDIFCCVCGYRLKTIVEEEVCCPKCKTVLTKGARFCIQCGEKIPLSNSEKETVRKEKETVHKILCSACGKELMPGDVYCDNCGTRVL